MRSAFSSKGVLFSGKQCARKRASTVWGGADRKGQRGTSLAADSTDIQRIPWGAFHFFAYDEFIMRTEIWMSQIRHAHNCRAVQKNETHPQRSCSLTVERFCSILTSAYSETISTRK